jgi:hypothetical protein
LLVLIKLGWFRLGLSAPRGELPGSVGVPHTPLGAGVLAPTLS